MRGAKGSSQQAGGTGAGKDLQQEIDALFQLPLTEFTAARNALAARMKKAGRTEQADQIKALPKPSVAAWAANQLYWAHRSTFERLIDAGERFRKAQTAQLSGAAADMREPLEARRAALSELSAGAAELLRQAGSSATPDTMRRITTTLEALSTYAGLPDAPRPGRLTDDVQPPGFETLAALVPRLAGERTPGPTRVLPFQQKTTARRGASKKSGADDETTRAAERKERAAAARAAVTAAERTLRAARKAAHRAEEELKKAAARAKEAEQEKVLAEQQLEQAAAAAEAARKNARAVAAQAEEAAQEVSDAERALEKATTELTSIINDR